MIEETGVVKQVEGNTARVLVQRKSECEKCASAGICEPAQGGMEIEALNPIHAQVGQKVKVSIKPQAYLKGTMIVYAFPLIALITGAIIGKNIGDAYFKEVNSDLTAAILGFIFLAITFIIIKLWSKKVETKLEYKPVIEEILQ
ncbi:MAG: SoxR reducing system RseC family protein [Nitrospirae bacterium]|nr:SoxR reducing system RseC family protein [Nitrospirota bacterium]